MGAQHWQMQWSQKHARRAPYKSKVSWGRYLADNNEHHLKMNKHQVGNNKDII